MTSCKMKAKWLVMAAVAARGIGGTVVPIGEEKSSPCGLASTGGDVSIAGESTSLDHCVASHTQTSQGNVHVVETAVPLAIWAPEEAFTLNVQSSSPSQAESTTEDSDSNSAQSPDATQSFEDGEGNRCGSAEPVVPTIVNDSCAEYGDVTAVALSQSSLGLASAPSVEESSASPAATPLPVLPSEDDTLTIALLNLSSAKLASSQPVDDQAVSPTPTGSLPPFAAPYPVSSMVPVFTPDTLGNAYGGGYEGVPLSYLPSSAISTGPEYSGIPIGYEPLNFSTLANASADDAARGSSVADNMRASVGTVQAPASTRELGDGNFTGPAVPAGTVAVWTGEGASGTDRRATTMVLAARVVCALIWLL